MPVSNLMDLTLSLGVRRTQALDAVSGGELFGRTIFLRWYFPE